MASDKKPTLTPALRYLPESLIDHRTDAEIEELVCSYRPVTHEKNCWTFWDSGFENMPRWCKRNVIGWVRRLGPEWDVRCINMVEGSLNNASNFIGEDYLPNCFWKKTMSGKLFAPQHASDMVRFPLVYLYGGVWIDSGAVLLRSFNDNSFWNLLEDSECPYEAFFLNFQWRPYEGQIINGFFGARKGNPFVERVMKVFNGIWKDRTDCDGLRYHPLIRHLGLIDGQHAGRINIGGPSGDTAHLMADYLGQNYALERVRTLVDQAGNWDGPAYSRKHICYVSAERELWKYAAMLPAEMHTKLMTLPFKPELTRESKWEDPLGPEAAALAANQQSPMPGAAALAAAADGELDEARLQQVARDWLTAIASSSLIVKLSGGYWFPGSGWPMPLSVSWVQPGHEDDDIMPGTWAEWLRYASTHLQQTRKVPFNGTYLAGPDSDLSLMPEFLRGEALRVLHAGLLEPAPENDGWEFVPPRETS